MLSFWTFSCVFAIVYGNNIAADLQENRKCENNTINAKSTIKGDLLSSLAWLFEESLNIFAPVSDTFDNELCRNHSLLYKDGVLSKKLWALTMFDASAKLPSGVLTGNLVQLGNYDECLGLVNIDTVHGRFSGQHCLVTVGGSGYFSETNYRRKIVFGLADDTFPTMGEHPEGYVLEDGFPFSGVTWSLCIPSTCHPRDLELHLRATLGPLVGDAMPIRVPDLACSSADDPPPGATPGDYAAWTLLSLIAILVVGSTTYDLQTLDGKHQRSPVWLSFSAYSNALSVLKCTSEKKREALPVIDGVRVLSTLTIVLHHVSLSALVRPILNMDQAKKFSMDSTHHIIAHGSGAVDVFFMLSGALVSFSFLTDRDEGAKFSLVRFYWNRYIRLTPMYALLLLMSGTVAKGKGHAPGHKETVSSMVQSCQQHGWLGLVYLSNYFDTDRQCVGVGWSLAVDMQLFWLSPLILFPLFWRPKFGKALLGALIFIGYTTASVLVYVFKQQTLNTYLVSMHSAPAFPQYFPTHARFTPWVIGMALGYYLRQSKKSPSTMSRGVVLIGWTISACLLLVVVCIGHQVSQLDYQHDTVMTALSVAFCRPAIALSLAWLVYACSTGNGGFLNSLLTCRALRVLSKLSYAVFFAHFLIVGAVTIFSKKGIQHYNDMAMIVEFLGITVLSYVLGFVFSVTMELPAINLNRALSADRSVLPKKKT